MSALELSLIAASPAVAQQADNQRQTIAAAAEQAAAQAENAAAEAERAMIAARQAAQAARAAANSARLAAGGMPAPVSAAVPAAAPEPLPPSENLPVTRGSAQQQAANTAIAASVANGPNDSALKTGAGPDLELIASTKDKVASLAWTVDVSGEAPPGTLDARKVTLTATSKLNDSGDAQFLGLGGFAAGTEVKLSFTHFTGAINLSGVEKPSVAEARAKCLARPAATAAACDPYEFSKGVSAFVAEYNPLGLRSLLREVIPGPIVFYGVNASANQASYKFLDRPSFSVKKEDHLGFGAGVFGGLLFNYGQTAVIGSFDYKRSFKESDPVTLCRAVAGTDLTQCITSPDGAPKQNNQSIVGLELRHAFRAPVGSFASIAISPKFSADLSSDAYSLSVPVYLVGDGTGKLRGGVRVVYLNKKADDGSRVDDTTLGVFVGVPFSVFP